MCVVFLLESGKRIEGARADKRHEDSESLVRWEVSFATVVHLSAVVEIMIVTFDGDVSRAWVRGARGSSSNHDNRT